MKRQMKSVLIHDEKECAMVPSNMTASIPASPCAVYEICNYPINQHPTETRVIKGRSQSVKGEEPTSWCRANQPVNFGHVSPITPNRRRIFDGLRRDFAV